MKVPFSPPDINEDDITAVAEVLRSGWITSGPLGEDLRQELTNYCGSADTILVNSATAGLQCALRYLGIGPGDEVITTAYTYTASASVITHVGAKVVLVDTEPGSFFVSAQTWAAAITERTKAIIAVDLGGVRADLEGIYAQIEDARSMYRPANEVQEQLGRIAIIVDGAHSLGAIRGGKTAGSEGDFTAFSFHAVKNLTTAEGGALTWSKDLPIPSDEIYGYMKLAILHGQSKSALEKTGASSWEYDVVFPGHKLNMPDVLAAIAHSQLKRYPQMIAKRHEYIELYDELLETGKCTALAHRSEGEGNESWYSSGHLYLLRLTGYSEAERNVFIEDLSKQGIAANVHYKPLPMLSAYKRLGFDIAHFPNAYAQYQNQITLPLHTSHTLDQIKYVRENIAQLLRD